jgi:signal transduction histidine kinase
VTTEPRVSIDELRTLFLFEGLADEQLRHVAEQSDVRAYPAGGIVYREGEPSDALWVLLDGSLRLSRRAEGEEVIVNETDHRGSYAGAVRAFASTASMQYQTTLTALRPSRFLRFPADQFAAFVQRWFPMAKHLFDGLYMGIQTTEATVRQREHLAQLGRLSANLAHELNNPAAAAVRATEQLRSRVAHMRNKLGMITESRIQPETIRKLIALQEAAVERAAKKREPLTALQESDLEDELADRLEELGVSGTAELAPIFVAAGLDVTWFDDVAVEVGGQLEGAVRWIGYTLETEALMDELEDAATRISTLVASVKQYSHMDQSAHQEIDLHPGLESTLVMLGHKLAGVSIERDYSAALPPVPAYAAELNQVWTNLIDNAVDAMHGEGVLRLRTFQDSGHAVVEVQDTGAGIPEQVRGRVFDAFVTTKPPGSGTGLGLENARRIIERRHHGSLTFVTGEDGTTFTARLPLSR